MCAAVCCKTIASHGHLKHRCSHPPQTKTQQIRLLEQDKSAVQRELDQLRASINDGTTEVQRLVARDRRVQEEIVRELQVRRVCVLMLLVLVWTMLLLLFILFVLIGP